MTAEEGGPVEGDAPAPPTSAAMERRRRWRRPRTSSTVLFVVPLALLIAGGFALQTDLTLLDPVNGLWALTQPWGNTTYTLSGLQDPVTVVFDGAGTVHIYAQDDDDLVYAQGWTQASQRLFQMEAESLEAQGNISSWVGSAGIDSDIAFRTLGLPQAALQMQADMESYNPYFAGLIESYCAGVNAYIAYAQAHGVLSIYFSGLGVQPYRWTPFDLFAFERLMVYSQTTGIAEPLLAGLAADTVGANATNEMFPIYPQYWQNFTVLPGNGTIDGDSLASEGTTPSAVFDQDWYGSWATGIPDGEQSTLAPLYRAALSAIDDPYFPTSNVYDGGGSNSWVVSANHSVDDLPMVANDPHLPIMLPSLWVPTELVDPSYDVEGWALAGLPGILIGHNPHLAWALTNSEGSTAVEYVETLRGDSYLYDGSWYPLTWDNQTFNVAGGSSQSLALASTNNGPLLARVGNYGLSLRWAADGPTWEAFAEMQFDRAVSVSQFFQEMNQYWTIPNLNVLVAEDNATSGATHIGWLIPCQYPLIRETLPGGGPTIDVVASRTPLNGSGGFEPVGTIPVNLKPQSIDPAQGYLFAPNQPTVGQEYPYPFIGSFWDGGGRAHAIGSFLAQNPTMSIPLMQELQSNVTDAWTIGLGVPGGSSMKAELLTSLQSVAGSGGAAAALASTALPIVQDWNGSFITSEVGATIYTYWVDELTVTGYDQVLWDRGDGGFPDPFPNALLATAQSDPSSVWFPGGWSTFSESAASAALLLLKGNLTAMGDPAVSDWTWGVVHPFTLPSLTGKAYLAEGPYPHWGDGYTVSVAPSSSALSVPLQQVSIGSSLRMVSEPNAALANGGTTYGIIPGGATEDPASPYYANQLPYWLAHEELAFSLNPTKESDFQNGVVATWELNP